MKGNLNTIKPSIASMSYSNKIPNFHRFTMLLASSMINSKTTKNPVYNSLKLSNLIVKMPFFTITEDVAIRTWENMKNQFKTLNKL